MSTTKFEAKEKGFWVGLLESMPKWCLVVIAATILTAIGVSGVFIAASEPGSGKILPMNYPVMVIVLTTIFGCILPVTMFAVLDSTLDYSAWNWLGKRRPEKCSSSEIERKGKFLLHKWNCHSSFAMIFAGVYIFCRIILDNCRAKVAASFMASSLVLMGFISYAWWGSRASFAWHADNFVMELIVSNFSYMFLSLHLPQHEALLGMITLILFVLRGFTRTGDADLLVTGILSYLVAFYCVSQLGGQGIVWMMATGFGMMMFGFAPKVADIFDNFAWGTVLFHFIESFAWVVIFEWSQTLPLSSR